MTTSTAFISTAIPYVNARPHLGFAYELVLADAIARHRRRRGRDVRFVTGTDDNGLKNVTAAARAGLAPADFVERNAAAFLALGALLEVAPDDVVRTSRDPRHRVAVDWLWRACAAHGDLYRRAWHGRYCTGCEAFVDDGVEQCPEHGVAPEPVSEDNWFFRLSRWRDPVRDAIESGRLAITPDSARAETLAFLAGPVRDLSVSRVASRAGGWGIPVPDDPDQVIYVWFDALTNYLSSLDLGADDGGALLARYWRGGGERRHVIGKGITRFHAVYWPAFLLSAGLPLPDRIDVHGYLTQAQLKLSKSAGNALAVDDVVARHGVDAVRWYFLRACRTRGDTDVVVDDIDAAYDRDLADSLGNSLQRCVVLAGKAAAGRVPPPLAAADPDANELRALATALPARVDAAIDAFALDDAAAAITALLGAANRTLDRAAPWRRLADDPDGAARALYAPLEAIRIAAGELEPFVPGVARTIAARLGGAPLAPAWGGLTPGAPLVVGPPPFPRRRRR